jgi:Short C-terminal domain
MKNADELAKLFELKKQGVITEDEFNREKNKLLNANTTSPTNSIELTAQQQQEFTQYKEIEGQWRKAISCGKLQLRIISSLLVASILLFIYVWIWRHCEATGGNPRLLCSLLPKEYFIASSWIHDIPLYFTLVGILLVILNIPISFNYHKKKKTRLASLERAKELQAQLESFSSDVRRYAKESLASKPIGGWFGTITNPTPIWVAYLVNAIAWTVFVMTGNHILEFLMGVACIYVGLVAISKRHESNATWLIYVSFADALWMFYWAFAKPMDINL